MSGRPTADIVDDLQRFAPLVFWPADLIPSMGGTDVAGTLREAADLLVDLDRAVNVTLDGELTAYERMQDEWLDAEGCLRERVRELNARLMPPPTGPRIAGVPPWQGGRLLRRAT